MNHKIIAILLGLCIVGGHDVEATSLPSVLALLSPYFSQASNHALSHNQVTNVTSRAHTKRSGDLGPNRLFPDPDIALAVIPYSRSKGLPVNYPFCDCRRCGNNGNDNYYPPSTRGYDYNSNDRERPVNSFTEVDVNHRTYRSNDSSGRRPGRGSSEVTSTPFPRTGSTIYTQNRLNSDFLDNGRYHPTTKRPVINKDVRFRYPEAFNLNSK